MVGEMHILSPLVPPREFYFIRYCRQFSDMDWVIVDVSGDFLFERANVRNPAYKLPSGCLIREMPDGKSKVCSFKKFKTHIFVKIYVINTPFKFIF
jgi:homeobox-leucine zipper protein